MSDFWTVRLFFQTDMFVGRWFAWNTHKPLYNLVMIGNALFCRHLTTTKPLPPWPDIASSQTGPFYSVNSSRPIVLAPIEKPNISSSIHTLDEQKPEELIFIVIYNNNIKLDMYITVFILVIYNVFACLHFNILMIHCLTFKVY